LQTADFQCIFAGSASTVTPSKKSPTNTNRKFITRLPMSLKINIVRCP